MNKELYRRVYRPSKNVLQFKGQHSTSSKGKAGERQAACPLPLLSWIYVSRSIESKKSNIMKKEVKPKEIRPNSTWTWKKPTYLQRVSLLCCFLFFKSILVMEELKLRSSKSSQSSELFTVLARCPHLRLVFGLSSPFIFSVPVAVFCYKDWKETKPHTS